MSRLLALLLALTAVLPTEAWARVAELCREPDTCCCRRENDEPARRPEASRIDCCESACATPVAAASAPTNRSDASSSAAATAAVSIIESYPRSATVVADPVASRTRGPPRPRHELVQHWLI